MASYTARATAPLALRRAASAARLRALRWMARSAFDMSKGPMVVMASSVRLTDCASRVP